MAIQYKGYLIAQNTMNYIITISKDSVILKVIPEKVKMTKDGLKRRLNMYLREREGKC